MLTRNHLRQEDNKTLGTLLAIIVGTLIAYAAYTTYYQGSSHLYRHSGVMVPHATRVPSAA